MTVRKQNSILQKAALLLGALTISGLVAGILLTGLMPTVRASELSTAETYTNTDTGYQVVIDDMAQLLSDSEKKQLQSDMQGITAYGNAVFVSTDSNYDTAQEYAESYYSGQFGSASGTLFLIDMDNREIRIYSRGAVYQVITKSYANVITDNVYSYASDKEYYQCAQQAFSQMLTVLQGQKISQPMKYISNALLALLVALLLNYGIVKIVARDKKPSRSELLGSMNVRCNLNNPRKFFVNQTRVYSPRNTDSGSGGGGGGFSGGGGGGSSSGGGGGHSF